MSARPSNWTRRPRRRAARNVASSTTRITGMVGLSGSGTLKRATQCENGEQKQDEADGNQKIDLPVVGGSASKHDVLEQSDAVRHRQRVRKVLDAFSELVDREHEAAEEDRRQE